MRLNDKVLSAILSSLGIIIGIIEAMIPSPFAFILGAKLGLANIVSLLGLYLLPLPVVFGLLVIRVLVVSLVFASMSSSFYSFGGAMVSLAVMWAIKRWGKEKVSIIGVSVMGAVSHNFGQLTIASIFTRSWFTYNYLPILSLTGILSGFLTGLVGLLMLEHLEKLQANRAQSL